VAAPAMATITWEAHYNDGDKNADYAAGGVVEPWASQCTTPLTINGFTGGGVSPQAASQTNLNYPLNGVNVNRVQGTLSVRVKPNFDSTQTGFNGVILSFGGSHDTDTRRWMNVYFHGSTHKWLCVLGSLRDDADPSYAAIRSDAASFNKGSWLQLGLTWNHSTGDLMFYVDGVAQTPTNVGTDFWSIDSGGYAPWGIAVGNEFGGTLPYSSQFNGLIDDVVISDVYQDTAIFSRTPEPATLTLLAAGMGFAVIRRRK
jgi:hypothetical protein